MKKCISVGLIFLGILMCFVSCKKKIPPPPPEKPAAAPILSGSMIYFDTSMSIRGYFRISPNTGTTLQRFLWEDLLGILAEENLTPACVSLFGSRVPPPEEIQSLRKWTFFEAQKSLEEAFPQNETNLIGVFETADFSKRKVSIVISDGIQSAVEGERSRNIVGFDKRIFNVIRDIGKAGTHLWLIGVRSEFNGYIYPERLSYNGLRHPFIYLGLRPVYIWIASREAAAGHVLAERIVDKIRAIAGIKDNVKVVSLTTLSPPLVNLQINTAASSSPLLSKEIGENQFEWLIAKAKESRVEIPVSFKADALNKLDISWNIRLELKNQNHIKWAELQKKDNEWILSISYRDIPGRSRANLCIYAIASPEIERNPWWREWSTEDDSLRENAEKTLYIGRLNPVIEELLRKTFSVGQISIRIRTPK